jgi:hypothetical protein
MVDDSWVKQHSKGITWTRKEYDDYLNSIKWKRDQKHPDGDWYYKEDLSWPFFIHWPEITIMTNIEDNA